MRSLRCGDVYLATFGLASHLEPAALRRLLGQIADHARPGAVVALEALGARSLEWPRLWDTRPGAPRLLLAGDGCARSELARPLPPLPAGAVARAHHRLAERRRRVIARHRGSPADLARAVWALEPRSAAGIGHGLVVVGRVTRP